MFSLSSIVRSIGIFYSFFYGLPLLVELFKALLKKQIINSIKIIITGLSIFFIISSPFFIYLINSYFEFCIPEKKSDFCNNTIPNIYSYS